MQDMSFENYKDPERAQKVWKAYLPALDAHELTEQARDALTEKNCSTSEDLDLILDRIIKNELDSRKTSSAPRHHIEDIDSNGWHSNARKVLED